MPTLERRAGQHSKLYTTRRWRELRARQLHAFPLCAFCEQKGRVTMAAVVDHTEPHRGDLDKFWSGPFQSLCATCHNSDKQRIEKGGKPKAEIGLDGWPVHLQEN